MNPFQGKGAEELNDLIARARLNLTINQSQLSLLDVQLSIDKRNLSEDTRNSADDIIDKTEILQAQYNISKRNKQKDVDTNTGSITAIQAAIAALQQ